MKDYREFVYGISTLLHQAKSVPLGCYPPTARPTLRAGADRALFFAPHPDDECLSGGIALRMFREAGMDVANVAVTQGSNKERQAARFQELTKACHYLGIRLLQIGSSGLEGINPKSRSGDPAHWESCVDSVYRILQRETPRVVVFPHEQDWNSTHIGTHYLVVDALKRMPATYECLVVESEFWGQMADPNLMVEISDGDLVDMVTATSFHVGEVERNPYHLLLPAWMMDNVRRGGELVGGQGGAAPKFTYATLYRLGRWSGGKVQRFYQGGRMIAAGTNIGSVFE